jgi:CelD/BcsL family acetyltransferase involved in cellulose biosynthesis
VLLPLDGGVSDYNAPILFDGAATIEPRLLIRKLRAALPAIDAVMLDKMPAQAAHPLAIRPRKANCAYEIDLSTTWEAYFATQRHRPKDSRRKRRRLAELGPVRFLVAQSELERERIFHAMIAQKTRRYLEKNGIDGFDRPGYRAYFREMTTALHPRGHVHLSALEVGGELVATHWGLVANGRFYCLMLAFADGAAARYSPASLLVEELIAWSFGHGLRTFDLGVGEAEWKRLFGAKRTPLTQHHEAVTPLGWAYLNARKLRDSIGAGQPSAPSCISPASRPIQTSAQTAT